MCALWLRCVFVTSHPRPVRWLTQTHCDVAMRIYKQFLMHCNAHKVPL